MKQPIISTEGEVSIINAAQTGVFVAATDHMGAIEMGTHIGDIIEPIEGKVIQRIESPTNGIIFTLRENPVVEIRNFDARVFCGEIGREAWGYIEYEQALFPGQAQSYELILAPGQEKR